MIENRNTSNTLSALALIIAIAAFVVAWLAFNRTEGPTLEDRAGALDTNDVSRQLEEAAEKTEALTREGVGEAVKKTGEVLESGGEATQDAGADIQNDNRNMQR